MLLWNDLYPRHNTFRRRKMKCLKVSLSALLLIAIFILSPLQVLAENGAQLQDQASQALVRLEILKADKKGSLRLKEKTKRYEFITFVNAAMSYDVEADSASADVEFKDLTKKHAAWSQIRAAAAHGLIEAYEDGTVRPDKAITAGDALVILMKALGYGNDLAGLDHDGILGMAAELGITSDAAAPKFEDALLRGTAAIYIYNFMSIDFKQ